MRNSKSETQKKRGRPTRGGDPVSAVRLPTALTADVDLWAAHNGAETRPDAIRRYVEIGLEHSRPSKRRSLQSTARASELASEQIDKLGDPSLPEPVRHARKRKLIKGPKEFRDVRTNQSKREPR